MFDGWGQKMYVALNVKPEGTWRMHSRRQEDSDPREPGAYDLAPLLA